MEVNLLNRTGIHRKENHKFTEVDNSLISNVADNLNNDFESKHKVKRKITVKTRKKNIFITCLFTILIIGASFYYKFFISQKIFIDSQKFQSLMQYVVNDNNLNLLEFNFDNYSIDLRFEIDSKDVFAKDLKIYLNNIS